MNTTASSARSRSASSNTITGFLPPSSKCTRFRVGAPCAMIAEPVDALADEGDRLDRGMLGQRLAGFLADAVHGVEHAVGNAGLLHQLRQQVGGDRRPFRRLVHHGAAGGQRRGDLPGREHERRVPRRDDADRADRHPGRDVPVLVARRVQPVAGIGAFVGEEAEILRGADRGLGHEAMRLAGVDAFEHGDIVGAVLDGVGDPMQQFLARRRRHVAPRLEGAAPPPSRRGRYPRHCRAPPTPAPRRRSARWSRTSRRRSTARSCRR